MFDSRTPYSAKVLATALTGLAAVLLLSSLVGCGPQRTMDSAPGMAAPGPVGLASPLSIPSPVVGNNEVVHPTVVVFDNAWKGYTHWMAFTPYPNSSNLQENPCIVASNDGISWETPSGASNPLVNTPPSGYNSDPHLIYDAASSQLFLFYRQVANGGERIYLTTSSNGVSWSTSNLIANFPSTETERCISPVIRKIDGYYWMWYVDARTTTQPAVQTMKLRKSKVLSPEGWGPAIAVTPAVLPDGTYPWHLDVTENDGTYYLLLASGKIGTMSSYALHWLVSPDGINWSHRAGPINFGDYGWNQKYYRSSFIITSETVRVWYSVMPSGGPSSLGWRIGFGTILR